MAKRQTRSEVVDVETLEELDQIQTETHERTDWTYLIKRTANPPGPVRTLEDMDELEIQALEQTYLARVRRPKGGGS